jgi:hypothetical protein
MILDVLAGLTSGLSSIFSYFGQKQQADRARTMVRARLEKNKKDISERSSGGAGEILPYNINDSVVSQYDNYTDEDFVTDPSVFGNILVGASNLLDIYNTFKSKKNKTNQFGA